MKTKEAPKFSLGQIVATPNALDALQRNGRTGVEYLRRHVCGDWGILSKDDECANEEALESGARLLSNYLLPDETKLWVITDAEDERGNRQATTLLLPEDY